MRGKNRGTGAELNDYNIGLEDAVVEEAQDEHIAGVEGEKQEDGDRSAGAAIGQGDDGRPMMGLAKMRGGRVLVFESRMGIIEAGVGFARGGVGLKHPLIKGLGRMHFACSEQERTKLGLCGESKRGLRGGPQRSGGLEPSGLPDRRSDCFREGHARLRSFRPAQRVSWSRASTSAGPVR